MKTVRYLILVFIMLFSVQTAWGYDLADVKKAGVLRHLGVPYANFVTGSGDGLDVELMKLFAHHLGVKYEYVQTSWKDIIGDLTGRRAKAKGDEPELLDEIPIRGDVISNGFTVLPWREKVVSFSVPTFPTQVWLIVRADSAIQPIVPTGDIVKDIAATKAALRGEVLLGMPNTCLDISLYKLEKENARPKNFGGSLNEIAPAIINKEAGTAILDVPDALVALEKWPGEIKVIGPISENQMMATAFRKESPELLASFNAFLAECKKDGTYINLVKKYYPAVFDYYKDFFKDAVKK